MLTFIATAHKETIEAHLFISSLILQTDPEWKCIIVCDGFNEYVENVVGLYKDSRIELFRTETPTGFWGHYNRIYALNKLVDTEFVIQTSIQDYYIPTAVKEICNASTNADFVYFNSLHNHFSYNELNTELKVCKIDWGNFAIRTSIARQVGIHHPESNTCDGQFVEKCAQVPNLRINKINKILTVHN